MSKGAFALAHLQAPDRSPEMTDALKARAHELKRLGLATEIGRNIFQFEPGWRTPQGDGAPPRHPQGAGAGAHAGFDARRPIQRGNCRRR